ncbi:MAG TPA: hypothetical protein VLZ75_07825 [Chitinophagales bacterium]|nr:hypothetical protein [Chitinophagales bacterium]
MSVFVPVATLLCALMMAFLNISVYKSGDWSWTNILLSIGIGMTLIAYLLMILRNQQAYWLQLLGTLFSLIFVLPLFFKTFLAILNGRNDFLFSFLTMCIILILQVIISMYSYQNIEKPQKEQ